MELKKTFSLPSIGSVHHLLVLVSLKDMVHQKYLQLLVLLKGGTVIVLDDFGYSSGIADAVGISYSNHRLYDDEYLS